MSLSMYHTCSVCWSHFSFECIGVPQIRGRVTFPLVQYKLSVRLSNSFMVVCDLLPFLIPSTHRASRLRYSPATTNTPAAASTANAQPKKGFSFCRPLF